MSNFAPPGYYSMTYYCHNCKSHYEQIFEKGEPARQGTCTNCECNPGPDRYREDY